MTQDRRRGVLRRLRRGVRRRLGGKESTLLFLYGLGFLVTGVGNSVQFKKCTNAMPNYGWFLTLMCTVAYIPIFGAVVTFDDKVRKAVGEETRSFPKRRFVLMALFDACACLTGVVGGAFTSGPTQQVLNQTVIPFTLFLSTLLLRLYFHWVQHLGSFIIILGALIAALPSFMLQKNGDRPIFNIIYLTSSIAAAFSQVYKEIAFRDVELNVNYMQYYVGFYQTFWTALLAPVNALPFLGSQQIPLARQLSMVRDGSACLFEQKNTIVTDCGGIGQPICDHCQGAYTVLIKYIAFNALTNTFALSVTKQGGAALCYVLAALRLPLTTLCFYSTFIMGPEGVVPPSIWDFLGLSVLIGGLVLYRWGASKRNTMMVVLCDDVESYDDLRQPWVSRSLDEFDRTARSIERSGGGLFECLPPVIQETLEELVPVEEHERGQEIPELGNVILGLGPQAFSIHTHRSYLPIYLKRADNGGEEVSPIGRRSLTSLGDDDTPINNANSSNNNSNVTRCKKKVRFDKLSIMLDGGLDLSLGSVSPRSQC